MFNLTPGCSPCNAHLKGEKHFTVSTHINPFQTKFDDYFQFRLKDIVFSSKTDVSIVIENIKMYSRSSINDFKIEERYNDQNTKVKVFNLVEGIKNRSPVIQKSLLQQFSGLFGKLDNINRTLLKSQGVPIEAKQINDFEMGKMKRDICKQMGLIQS
ncbi:hypothetical protein N7U66_00305 [Lacinutrix neustonica]|uniref:Uncharacterized protein n=1 Tax=Lacinutrix neustonica TaxID=2980107 RepID=A0A9E8MVC7_9FLAO|nr:hypothetical protein [Lacinutrix neustonica]WAC02263.1 hypothetical protein N7U66_00305 [Lacinutrix neustonica]